MTTIHEFVKLSSQEKIEYVQEYGVLLTENKGTRFLEAIYSIHPFFVLIMENYVEKKCLDVCAYEATEPYIIERLKGISSNKI